MGTLTDSGLRAAIAARIAAIGAPYAELPRSFDLVMSEPATIRHAGYAVTIDAASDLEDRQRPGLAAYTLARASVVLFWRATPKDQIASLDDALDAASAVRVAVCGRTATYPGDASIRWRSRTGPSILPDPLFWRTLLTFDVRFQAPN